MNKNKNLNLSAKRQISDMTALNSYKMSTEEMELQLSVILVERTRKKSELVWK